MHPSKEEWSRQYRECWERCWKKEKSLRTPSGLLKADPRLSYEEVAEENWKRYCARLGVKP